MRELVIGIDSGTQSTKALVVDAKSGKLLGEGSRAYGLISGLPAGAKEQHPADWIDATESSIRAALKQAKATAGEVRAIGVSGQQHGFVPLDKKGEVIRPAKLWCDTSTADECEEIMAKLGGLKGSVKELGNAVLPGFTAGKILWLKKNEPKNFRRLAKVLLPHDYLNFWLTGNAVMEFGDASGTALLNVRTRKWSKKTLKAIDAGLEAKLPKLISSDQPAGTLQAATARRLGLHTDVLVSAGGGDNMMGAIGTGNTRPGVVTASFGTSGTIYACAGKPVVDPKGEIAAFCDSTNRWLPLLCTMNVTVATELIRKDFKWTHAQYEAAARKAPAGSDGCCCSRISRASARRTCRTAPASTSGACRDVYRKTFCARDDGGRHAWYELRPASTPETRCQAHADSCHRWWGKLQTLAADHGRYFQRPGCHAQGGRGGGLRSGTAGLWSLRNNQGGNVSIEEITDRL
ncbi:MAG: hypothetical protein Ct9H300mP7_4400 [Verrucomicrobiota bacterium]|nr:MAG: hypothetical protein Ct9H300mP7_4400 [Verrucomicrobiota bacterium]